MRLRFADEYRDGELGAGLAREVAEVAAEVAAELGEVSLMEVCGGHTHALWRFGITGMLPPGVRMVHGPGCPVCVLPTGRLDAVMRLVESHDLTLCTYGDVMRVPGSGGSLQDARARGADVRMVYSPLDALELAKSDPGRQVVFWAIGFETTAPATAATLSLARADGVDNFSVICNHVRVIPALEALLADPQTRIDGLIGPGHVAGIIGVEVFAPLCERFGVPLVVAGFEPVDLLAAILEVLQQLREHRHEAANAYRRVVPDHGNPAALALMNDCFVVRDTFDWRGLGEIASSAFALAEEWAPWDAERRFALDYRFVPDHRLCRCGEVLTGRITPTECRIFGTACTPEHPVGSCMVSSEGACAAEFLHGVSIRVGR